MLFFLYFSLQANQCYVCRKEFKHKNNVYLHLKKIHNINKNDQKKNKYKGQDLKECSICKTLVRSLYHHNLQNHGIKSNMNDLVNPYYKPKIEIDKKAPEYEHVFDNWIKHEKVLSGQDNIDEKGRKIVVDLLTNKIGAANKNVYVLFEEKTPISEIVDIAEVIMFGIRDRDWAPSTQKLRFGYFLKYIEFLGTVAHKGLCVNARKVFTAKQKELKRKYNIHVQRNQQRPQPKTNTEIMDRLTESARATELRSQIAVDADSALKTKGWDMVRGCLAYNFLRHGGRQGILRTMTTREVLNSKQRRVQGLVLYLYEIEEHKTSGTYGPFKVLVKEAVHQALTSFARYDMERKLLFGKINGQVPTRALVKKYMTKYCAYHDLEYQPSNLIRKYITELVYREGEGKDHVTNARGLAHSPRISLKNYLSSLSSDQFVENQLKILAWEQKRRKEENQHGDRIQETIEKNESINTSVKGNKGEGEEGEKTVTQNPVDVSPEREIEQRGSSTEPILTQPASDKHESSSESEVQERDTEQPVSKQTPLGPGSEEEANASELIGDTKPSPPSLEKETKASEPIGDTKSPPPSLKEGTRLKLRTYTELL